MRLPFLKKPAAEPTELSKADSRLLTILMILEEKRLSLVRLKGYEDIETALKKLPQRTIAERCLRMSTAEMDEFRRKFCDGGAA